jgi:hypothetical protein
MNKYLMCSVTRDVRFGKRMIPKLQKAISSTGSKHLLRGRVPLNLVAVFEMSWESKQ